MSGWRIDRMGCGCREYEEFVFGTTYVRKQWVEWRLARVFPLYEEIASGIAPTQSQAEAVCDAEYGIVSVPPANNYGTV